MHIQADDVADLFDQQRIRRELERLAPVRLEAECAPDLLDRRPAKAARFRHAAAAPTRRAARRFLERSHDHLLDVLIADLSWGTRTGLVVQAVQALAHNPSAPLGPNRMLASL
jgi:hypothetical protein